MKVIITIPAYNEEKNLPLVIDEIKKVMDNTNYEYKIMVYSDGSSDNTVKIAHDKGVIIFFHKRNRGLAETFKCEMKEILKMDVDIIVHTDADGQYPAHYIPLMIQKVVEGNDLVIGNRFGKGKYSGPFTKSLGNRIFAKVLSKMLKIKLSDTTTGFRVFTKEVARINLINNFTYTQEQIIKVAKLGLKINEINIKTRITPRPSRLFSSPLQYAFKAWINILRIYRDYDPLKFFGKIGLVFLIPGIMLGLWVIYSVITIGNVGGIPRVILSAVLILTGVQIILFGFLADMIRIK